MKLANAFTLAGTLLGVPSLTVLLLHAINEIRGPIPANIELGAAHDATLALLQALTAFSLGHAGLAVLGFLLACGCWLIGKELAVSQTHSRPTASAVAHPC